MPFSFMARSPDWMTVLSCSGHVSSVNRRERDVHVGISWYAGPGNAAVPFKNRRNWRLD
jgi:hypothetical protein